MTAKEYLLQARRLKLLISQKQEQIAEVRAMAEKITAGTNGERVQTSTTSNKVESAAIKLVSLEEELLAMRMQYIAKMDEIIARIQSLSDTRYIAILYERYVNNMSFEQISCALGYDYKWTCRLHGYALQEFDKLINPANNTTKHE